MHRNALVWPNLATEPGSSGQGPLRVGLGLLGFSLRHPGDGGAMC